MENVIFFTHIHSNTNNNIISINNNFNPKCMKKILSLTFIMVFFMMSCEAPYMITETITKDSTGKEVHVITKKYSDGSSVVVPQASFNVVTSPFWWGTPYYPYYSPRIVVPIGPRYIAPRSYGRRH